jgi:hypothetical protein
MSLLIEQYKAWCAAGEELVASVFHPTFDLESRATNGWPVTRLEHAFWVLTAYCALVALGIYRSRATSGIAEPRRAVSTAESFVKEPILYLVVLYNAVQVLLSAWMAVAIAVVFFQKRMSFTCNSFDASSTDVARVSAVHYY